MKLLYFDDFRLGVLRGDEVVDVSAEVQDIPHTGPGDLMNGLIEHFDNYRERLEAAAAAGPGISVADVRIRSPLPRPGNIDAMAVNYMEDGTLPAPAPINAFHKATNSV
ncbi:MAG: fumarylacetoacetate hydrolase, partial [Alphaproteobacteria bacterium]|nr:fumarylacetoacetate hydrolase [Alphaproteobacteria bacterium]